MPDEDDDAYSGGPLGPPLTAWSRTRKDVAIVLWPSFLAAAVETRFFFFWAFTTLSGALSLYLVRTEAEVRRSGGASNP